MKMNMKMLAILGVGISSLSLAGCYEVDYIEDAPPPVTVTPASNSVPHYGPPAAVPAPSNSAPYYGPPAPPPVSVTPNSSTPYYGAPGPQSNSTPHYGPPQPQGGNSMPYYGPVAQTVPAPQPQQAAPQARAPETDHIVNPAAPGVIAVVKTSDMRKANYFKKSEVKTDQIVSDRTNQLPDVK